MLRVVPLANNKIYKEDIIMSHQVNKTEREQLFERLIKHSKFTPNEKFINFFLVENDRGEKIILSTEYEVLYLATKDFSRFFPARNNINTFTNTLPFQYSPEEFIWKFDSLGFAETIKEIMLPTGVTPDDLLVTEPLSTIEADYTVDKSVDSKVFINLLHETRKHVTVENNEETFDSIFPLYNEKINNLSSKRITPRLAQELVDLESTVALNHIIILQEDDTTLLHLPKTEINPNELHLDSLINISDNVEVTTTGYEKVKFDRDMADTFLGLLKLGSIDSVVEVFLEYKKLKDTDENLYTRFIISQIGGKKRIINKPNEHLSDPLKGLSRVLSSYYETTVRGKSYDKRVTGFRPGKGIYDNVKAHANNKYIIKSDIKSFFDSVRFDYYERYVDFLVNPNTIEFTTYKDIDIIASNLADEMKEAFRDILVNPESKGLYMGNPLSPVLTNLLMRKVVNLIHNTLESINRNLDEDQRIAFTIYADDVTFSSNTYNGGGYFTIKYLTNLVDNAFKKYGLHTLHLSSKKTTRLANNRRLITGIRINHCNELTIARNKYSKIRNIVHRLHVTQDPNAITMSLPSLQSRLSFYRSIDDSGKIERLLKKYRDTLLKFNVKPGSLVFGGSDDDNELIEYLNNQQIFE